ncbi:MAG: hypothetical protein JEZ04_03860 [Spirochaetales bacterium]|nr:hypothetical protein [Spirochaetales bacterium]
MKRRNFGLLFTFFLLIFVLLFSGCNSIPKTGMEAWTHVIKEENFRMGDGFMIYRYDDERFNMHDWFDVWFDDTHWSPELGWSRFVDVFDKELGQFMYGLEFYDGYIEFPSYGKELTGATLRFYRMKAE